MTKIFPIAISLATSLACICSCEESPSYHKEILDETILNSSHSCNIDTIDLDYNKYKYANYFYVYNDSILIVVNSKPKEGYFIEFSNLSTNATIANMYKYGNGHSELLSANVELNNDMLFVNDYVKSQYAFINMDSLLAHDGRYTVSPRQRKHSGSPTAIPYKDMLLVENPYCYSSTDTKILQGVEQGMPRFLTITSDVEAEEPSDVKFNTRNVAVDGKIISDDPCGNIVYASFGQPNVEFYDNNLTLKKIVTGPTKLNAQYESFTMEDNGMKQIIYKEQIPYAYMAYCCDTKYVYLLYIGSFLKEETDIMRMKSHILQFDWHGNYIQCFDTGGFILSLSKSKRHNTFYATALDNDGNPRLIKLCIP